MEIIRSNTLSTQPNLLWLANIAPLKVLMGTGAAALFLAFLSLQYILSLPFYDLNLRTKGDLVIVGSSFPDPLRSNIVRAVKSGDENINVSVKTFASDPDYFTSFAQLDDFLGQQSVLYSLAASGKITLVFDDGSEREFHQKPRNLTSIPFEYWLINFFGDIALFVGVGFWSYRRGHPITRLLALAGTGFVLMQSCMAIYASRELALPGEWFRILIHLNHLGGFVFVWSLALLFCFYPRPLRSSVTLFSVSAFTLMVWVNEWLEWVEWPLNIFYFPSLFVVSIGFFLGYKQWLQCKDTPKDRVLFFWNVASIIICMVLVFAVYLLPIIFLGLPWVSTLVATGLALSVFLGFVLGANHSQLFGIESWWFRIWQSFSVFALLIVFEMVAVYLFGLYVPPGFELLLLVIWWFYFPVRQKFWNKAAGVSGSHIMKNKPALSSLQQNNDVINVVSGDKQLTVSERWCALLTDLYAPLNIKDRDESLRSAKVINNGLQLNAPLPNNQGYIELTGKNRGHKLFDLDDVKTVNTLIDNIAENENLRVSQQKTVEVERDRIMRDLHDDVASNLLTLTHQAESSRSQQLASDTLKNLREIIYSLDANSQKQLIDLLSSWRDEMEERLLSAHIELRWHQEEEVATVSMSPRRLLNLGRALREIASNAIKHAKPQNLDIQWYLRDETLVLSVTDDGQHLPIEQWQEGKGLCNIKRRASELEGDVQWRLVNDESRELCRVEVLVPIAQE